jgi:NRPS condensation-like uncharacterized protein
MDDKKEYIQIPKKDFEKIYEIIEYVVRSLDRNISNLDQSYKILIKLEGILGGIIDKRILEKIKLMQNNVDSTKSSLIGYKLHLVDIYIDILEKVKKEQIDKNNSK